MKLKIVTPERTVVDDDNVDGFFGMTEDGMVGILPKHVPMVAPLKIGVMHYTKKGQKYPLAVMGGLLNTDGKVVTILSDAAELGTEIDPIRAQQARERAEAALRHQQDRRDMAITQQALARALARLSLANRQGH